MNLKKKDVLGSRDINMCINEMNKGNDVEVFKTKYSEKDLARLLQINLHARLMSHIMSARKRKGALSSSELGDINDEIVLNYKKITLSGFKDMSTPSSKKRNYAPIFTISQKGNDGFSFYQYRNKIIVVP